MTHFRKTTIEETDLIQQIAQRALQDSETCPYTTEMAAIVDLVITHTGGTPLALAGLLTAEPETFWHDIRGIAQHLDRQSGKLGGDFRPHHAAH